MILPHGLNFCDSHCESQFERQKQMDTLIETLINVYTEDHITLMREDEKKKLIFDIAISTNFIPIENYNFCWKFDGNSVKSEIVT